MARCGACGKPGFQHSQTQQTLCAAENGRHRWDPPLDRWVAVTGGGSRLTGTLRLSSTQYRALWSLLRRDERHRWDPPVNRRVGVAGIERGVAAYPANFPISGP